MISFNELLLLFKHLYESKQHSYASIVEFTHIYCPFARGINNDGLIVPEPQILAGNAAAVEWCNLMTFFPVHHIEYWLEKVHEYPPNTQMDEFLRECGMGCQQHILPSVYYVKHPHQVVIKSTTVIELAHLLNMVTVTELAVYLYCIIIMGIFINDIYASEIFQLADNNSYIGARLFQGELDYLMTGGVGITSSFQNLAVQDGSFYDSQPFYQSISGELNPAEFKQLVQQERHQIESSTYLGNEVPQVIAMKKALQLPESYSNYLEHHGSRFTKVGQRVFDAITLGSSKRKDLGHSVPSNLEKATPIGIIKAANNAGNPLPSWFQGKRDLFASSNGSVNSLWGFTSSAPGQGGNVGLTQLANSF